MDLPLGPLTWIIDKVLGIATGRPRLRLSAYAAERGPMFGGVTYSGAVHVIGPPSCVVIRVVNVGRLPVEIETVGVELDDGELVTVSEGHLPEVLNAPGHFERDRTRESLAAAIGTRRIRQLVAIGTDGHRYKTKPSVEWKKPDTWPEP